MNNYELSPWVTRRLQKYRNVTLVRYGKIDPIREAFKVSKLIRKEAEIALKIRDGFLDQAQQVEPLPNT